MYLVYDKVLTLGRGGYEDRELMSLANTLITYEEHSKALDVLRVARTRRPSATGTTGI